MESTDPSRMWAVRRYSSHSVSRDRAHAHAKIPAAVMTRPIATTSSNEWRVQDRLALVAANVLEQLGPIDLRRMQVEHAMRRP